MQDIDWNDLRTLAALARQGSYAGAARELGVAETTVERRLRRLEQRLGTALLDRAANRVTLTAQGAEMATRADAAETLIDAAVDRVRGQDARATGTVRLSTVPILANYLLIPRLADLASAHPGLTLDLSTDHRDASLARRETDIALRFARPRQDAAALTRKLADLPFALYASTTHDGPLTYLRYSTDLPRIPVNDWITANLQPGDTIAPLEVTDAESLIAAARAGLGTALLPRCIGDRLPGLQRLDRPCDLSREVWIIVPRDLRPQARIAAVLKWIGAAFAYSTRVQS